MEPVQYHYGKFPPDNLDWLKLIPLIGPANAAIARYDGVLSAIPNAKVLLSPLATDEAVLSSRIEGTMTSLDEVLQFDAGGVKANGSSKEIDIQEVINYRRAMNSAVDMLGDLPLCQRLIRRLHSILLEGVRGKDKSPGNYREDANWIGLPGCKIEEARFVPISSDRLLDGITRWEKYIHQEEYDKLVQLAIIHAEFEALHPFRDVYRCR